MWQNEAKSTSNKDIVVVTVAVIVFVVLGVGIIGFGLFLLKDRVMFLQSAQRATGVVVVVKKVSSRQYSTASSQRRWYVSSYPVIRFDTISQGSRTITVTQSWIGGPRVGDRVGVVYKQDDENTVYIDSFMGLWADLTLVFLIGFGALVIPPYTIWRHLKGLKTRGA